MHISLEKKIKELEEKDRALEEKNKEFEEEIKKLKIQSKSEFKGINSKLSNYAQHAIENSKGPLKPEELFIFLMSDVFGKRNKETLTFIRKYSNNIDEVKKQLSQVLETLQIHMAYRKKQKELDDKFAKTLKTLKKTIEKEEEKEMKSGKKFKIQSSFKQYCSEENVSYKVTHEINCNNDHNQEVFEESGINKQGKIVKEGGKNSRKRKSRTDDDISSSQESGIKQITSKLNKRLKVNSSSKTSESSDSIEYMSVQESDENTEPMSLVNSEGSQSSIEPMSVASSEGSQSSTELMSISESSQSDEMSDEDSPEIIKKVKTEKKIAGKSSKQLRSRSKEDSSGKIETVPERQFHMRGKPL